MCVGACVCEHLCLVRTRVSVWACVYCARIHSYRIVHAFTSVSAHVGACVTHACVQAEVMQGERDLPGLGIEPMFPALAGRF